MILSPTPPVECLSAVAPKWVKSIRSPLAIIAAVQREISERVIPRRKIAIARAAICSSATALRVYASMTQSICASLSAPPSLFVRMTSTAFISSLTSAH